MRAQKAPIELGLIFLPVNHFAVRTVAGSLATTGQRPDFCGKRANTGGL
jgi:hypothetical protein